MPRSFLEEDLPRNQRDVGGRFDISDPHLRVVDQTKSHFGRIARRHEVITPIQPARSRESDLFAKLIEISERSLGALGLWIHSLIGNYGVTRAEKS
jgi:hypothetical protein